MADTQNEQQAITIRQGGTDVAPPNIAFRGQGQSGLTYQIQGTTLQTVELRMKQGTTIFSDTGAMSWMSANIAMNTNTGQGGLGGMFKRALSGATLFIVDFTPTQGDGMVAFSSDFPGQILPVQLDAGQSIILQKHAFLCAEKTVTLDIFLNQKMGAGFLGGEGFVLQRLTGPGLAFAELDGEIVEYQLGPGEILKVNHGHVAMFEPTVQFNVEMIKGFKNILFGGEGLFLATLTGPGRCWLQSMPMINLAHRIAQYLPHSSGDSGDRGASINVGGFRIGS